MRSTLTVTLALAAFWPAYAVAQDTAASGDHAGMSPGEYLATLAGCAACHTAEGGEPFAGGHVLNSPFGKIGVPNITQDVDTGIGDWVFEDFSRALHEGIGKDGEYLFPAMPWIHYTLMKDEDVETLWGYIRTIPAVSNEVDVNQLPFPFNLRSSLAVWRELFFAEGRFEPNPDKDEVWNRGAYIIEALAHCGACHTPRDALGGAVQSKRLMGSSVENWYAPDISNGPNSIISDVSVDELELFLAGESDANHVALGSMRQVVSDLSMVKREDVRAIAVYLKDQPLPEDAADAPRPPVEVSEELQARRKILYDAHCVSCHTDSGEGAPGMAASLVDAGGVIAQSPDNVISVMLAGVAPSGEFGVMPSFRDNLSDAEIAALANYVRTSWGNDAAPNATAFDVAVLRRQTQTADGLEVGATCPSVPSDKVSEDTRQMVADLARSNQLDEQAVSEITARYRENQPDATLTDTVVNLGSAYCLDVVEAGADRNEAVRRYLEFSNAVLADVTAAQ